MLKDPANPARQRAQLRVAECAFQLKGSPSLIAAVNPQDLEVDAERLYALSQAYRSEKKEAEMFLALNTLAQNYPVSKWTKKPDGGGNTIGWNSSARKRHQLPASPRYFPNGKYAFNCEWRIAWLAI